MSGLGKSGSLMVSVSSVVSVLVEPETGDIASFASPEKMYIGVEVAP